MSPMGYFIDAVINIDDIVVPLNIHHDHGYAKLTGITCLLPLGSIPLNMCSHDMQLTDTF